jgi:hypothetical protein
MCCNGIIPFNGNLTQCVVMVLYHLMVAYMNVL